MVNPYRYQMHTFPHKISYRFVDIDCHRYENFISILFIQNDITMDFKHKGCEDVKWFNMSQDMTHGNEHSSSIKAVNILTN